MSYHSDNHNSPADVPFRPAGTGIPHTWTCMSCGKRRSTRLGAKGVGVRMRCAVCVEAKKK